MCSLTLAQRTNLECEQENNSPSYFFTIIQSRVNNMRAPASQSFRARQRCSPLTRGELRPHAHASATKATAHHSFPAFSVVRACCAHAVQATPRKPALELVGGSSLGKIDFIIEGAVDAAG